MAGARQGLVRFSADGMAGPDSFAVLQLSRDGGAWNDFHRCDGSGFAAAMARKIVWLTRDVVDTDGLRTASLYCKYGGMDDRRTGAAAVADLRIDAHRQRNFSARGGGECVVYADRINGNVYGAGDPMPVPALPRNRTRAGAGTSSARRRCSCPC